MAKRRDGLAAIDALIATPPKGRTYCQTCLEDVKWGPLLRRWYEARKTGETRVSWTDFHQRIMVPAGYRLGLSAMMAHVRNHMGGIP